MKGKIAARRTRVYLLIASLFMLTTLAFSTHAFAWNWAEVATSTTQPTGYERIVKDDNGNAMAVFTTIDAQIGGRNYTPAAGWGGEYTIYGGTSYVAGIFDVAMNAVGDYVVAYVLNDVVGTTDRVRAQIRMDGVVTSTDISTNAISGLTMARVAISDNGDALVVWTHNNNLRYRMYRNGAWGTDTVLDAGTNPISIRGSWAPGFSVAADDFGNFIVAWSRDSEYTFYGKRFRNGAWSARETIYAGTVGDYANKVLSGAIMFGTGEAIVVWDHQFASYTGVRARRFNGTSWLSVETIDAGSAEGTASWPFIASGPNGTAMVIFSQSTSASQVGVYVNRFNGSTWAGTVNISCDLKLPGIQSFNVDIDKYGNAAAAFWYNNAFHLRGIYQETIGWLDCSSQAYTSFSTGINVGVSQDKRVAITPHEIHAIFDRNSTTPGASRRIYVKGSKDAYVNGFDAQTTNPLVNLNVTLPYNNICGGTPPYCYTEMRFSNNGTTWAPWEDAPSSGGTCAAPYTATRTNWNITSATYGGNTTQGLKRVYIQYRNSNCSSLVTHDEIEYGCSNPSWVGSIDINYPNETTTNPIVTLVHHQSLVSTCGNALQSRYSNDGTNWTGWQSYSDTVNGWDLTNAAYGGNATPGLKTVYVQGRDAYNNVSPPYSDTITYQIVDADGDGVPADQDCNDGDRDIYPGAPEICDGKDNDCVAGGVDGSEEPWLGAACDGPDTDLCMEGTYSCTAGAQTCSDNTGSTLDLCDNADNDCNPATADGSGEAWYGAACDGPDADLCMEGTDSCVAGARTCSDNTGSTPDLCDNADNDCNPATADGSGEAWYGAACDGPDADLCMEGTDSCVAGARTCSDNTGSTLDLCDGADNDCNPSTLDGSGETWFGTPCDGPDTDLCAEGSYSCTGGTQACSDLTGDTTELCDGADNDCDGSIDEDFPNLGLSCTNGLGECSRAGTYTCTSDQLGEICNAVPGSPVTELCNGLDDDCDGNVDNGLSIDNDLDGHYTFDSCLTPNDDCDDNNIAIWDCNTPVTPDPVVVPDSDDSIQVTLPNVTAGGDTTISQITDCTLDYPQGFTPNLSDLCYDITTTASFTGNAEICITMLLSSIPNPPGTSALRMLACDASGGNCQLLPTSSLNTQTDPPPPTVTLCAWTPHFSLFTLAAEPDSDFDGWLDSLDNCPSVFNPSQLDMDVDGIGDLCDSDKDGDLMPNDWETANGTNPNVADGCGDSEGDGYMNQTEFFLGMDPQVVDTGVPAGACTPSPWNLAAGFNMVSMPCETYGYTAYSLLQAIGNNTVVSSIQRFNPVSGAMETAGYDASGTSTGVDFPIVPGEGYIIYMFQALDGFTP